MSNRELTYMYKYIDINIYTYVYIYIYSIYIYIRVYTDHIIIHIVYVLLGLKTAIPYI